MFGSFSELQTHKSSKSSTGMFVKPIHLIAPLPGARLSWFPYLQGSAQCRYVGLDSPGRASTVLWTEPRQHTALCQSAPSPRAGFHLCSVCHTFSFGCHFIWGIYHKPLTWLGFCTSLLCSSSPFFQLHTAGMDHRPSLVSVLYKVILNDRDALKASALGDFEAFEN